MTVLADFWGPQHAPALAPADLHADDFDDAPDCHSRLYVPAGSLSVGPLGCTLDHRASGLPWLHGTALAGHSKEWTTEMAEASLAEYLASRGPRCSEHDCQRAVVTGGKCGACFAADNTDIETESEAAA